MMSDSDGKSIVTAINVLLPQFCNDWGIKQVLTKYVAKGAAVPAGTPLRCYILDNSDVQGALGYHDQVSDIPYAKVFVKTILDYGGTILYSINPQTPTLAQTISHEVFEMIGDLNANIWWSDATGGTLYAAEVCDPVESNIVKVTITAANLAKITIGISDWILPAWADPQSMRGPFNHNNTIKSPLTCDTRGYLITMTAGVISYVFASNMTAYTKAMLCQRIIKRGAMKLPATPTQRVVSTT
jgi:hypothetical protein